MKTTMILAHEVTKVWYEGGKFVSFTSGDTRYILRINPHPDQISAHFPDEVIELGSTEDERLSEEVWKLRLRAKWKKEDT